MNDFFRIKGSYYDQDGRLQKHGTLTINYDYTDTDNGSQWRAIREAVSSDH